MPSFLLLISKVRNGRFFHQAIIESLHHFLFSGVHSIGFKKNSSGQRMSEAIPDSVIAWVCVLVLLHNLALRLME